ncbi:hypothetical protein AB0L05_02080 [Nonomuraea pusilla]|uniref:hypothetical protein n=1 Tax=Nonomuraea pusilla TaxID=46177 RepID=UPI0033328A4E
MTFQKREMMLIDRLEPFLAELDYSDVVLIAARGSKTLPYYAVGYDGELDRWTFVSLGRLPLGNETPTFLYLICFPDWHGERFAKVGIGLINRIREHERHGGEVLHMIELPRWHARIAETMILADRPVYRPRTPLPQNGDTECMPWDFGLKLKLDRYLKQAVAKAH